MTHEADRSVVVIVLKIAFLGKCDDLTVAELWCLILVTFGTFGARTV